MADNGCDTVVVAATRGYGEYLETAGALGMGVFVCRAGRTFRPVERMAFYEGRAIRPEVPRILHRRDDLTVDAAAVRRLWRGAEPFDREVGRVAARLLRRGDERCAAPLQLVLLTAPGDPETATLAAPVEHRGRGFWARSQRYTALAALRAATSTADLAEAPAGTGSERAL
jgi:hypothetical protein